MLRTIQDPLCYDIIPGTTLSVGQIVQLVVLGDKIFVDKSDGTNPLGIVIYVTNKDAVFRTDRITGETDMFEIQERYSINSSLYCSKRGLFTTRQEDPNFSCVGAVISPPTAANSLLKFIWF